MTEWIWTLSDRWCAASLRRLLDSPRENPSWLVVSQPQPVMGQDKLIVK